MQYYTSSYTKLQMERSINESCKTPEFPPRSENPVPHATESDYDSSSDSDSDSDNHDPGVISTSCDYLHYLFSNTPDNSQSLKHHMGCYGGDENRHLRAAFHIYDLMCAGNLKDVRAFCGFFSAEDLKIILNVAHPLMYTGTILHALLYHNIGEETIELYKYLRASGASIMTDYYNNLPWDEIEGIFTCLPTREWTVSYYRIPSEFKETCSAVRKWESTQTIAEQYNPVV
jgi:hypothetical protein